MQRLKVNKLTGAETVEHYKTAKIEDLKKGEYFRLLQKNKTVYVRDEYSKEAKRYQAYKFEDVNSIRLFKKGTLVEVNFTF